MRADHGQICHAYLLVSENGHVVDLAPVAREYMFHLLAETAVDLLDDGVDTRHHGTYEAGIPLLKRFR